MEVGDTIEFIHSLNDQHLPVSAKLTVDRVYEVATKSLKKGLLKVADENLLTSASRKSDLETLMKLMLAQTMKPAVEKPAAEKPEEKTSELLTSPQLKRKASRNLEAPSAKEEDERCEPNNKAFTNYLRDSLAELAENERDFGLTIGQYGSKYPVEINKIKRELVKFIPIGSTFEKAWKLAYTSIAQTRSVDKAGKQGSMAGKRPKND